MDNGFHTMGWVAGRAASERPGAPRGIALMAVLAVLTVLSILAGAFVVVTRMEGATAQYAVYGSQAEALADSGIEHAKSLLWCDGLLGTPESDGAGDIWNVAFDGTLAKRKAEVDVDGIPNNGPAGDGNDAVWLPVHTAAGILVGRYAVRVEDECSKININTACLVPPQKPDMGLSPREIMLGDGRGKGLPVGREGLTRLMREKYGPNQVPGARGDDNENNSYLMADGLDNNANGVIDELDEGVNEQDEYVPERLFGDDRAFGTLAEAWLALAPGSRPSPAHMAMFRANATLVSRDMGARWDKIEHAWAERQNLNVGAAREVFKTLKQANEQYNFEGQAKKLRRVAANLVDYRDENSTLSTLASEYGVEAVCFNEVLANEGSIIRRPYDIQNYLTGDRAETRVHTLAYYYGHVQYGDDSYWSSHLHDTGAHAYRDVTEALQDTNVVNRERLYYGGQTAFPIDSNRVDVLGADVKVELRDYPYVAEGPYNGFKDFKTLLRSRGGGHIQGERVIWPENIWANGYLSVFDNQVINERPALASFPIKRSTSRNELYLDGKCVSTEDRQKLLNGTYRYAQLRAWIWGKVLYAEHPRVSSWSVVQGLQPRKYYRTYIQDTNLQTPTSDTRGGYLFCKRLDVDGVVQRSSEQEMKRMRYRYDEGKAQRADTKGCLDVYLSSVEACGPLNRNRVNAFYFARPDIIELINISTRPVCLRGWTLVANTGSLAYELGRIDSATLYAHEQGGRVIDPNPVIQSNQYFYLCNNAEIFDYDFGAVKNGIWGSGANEAMPLYEIEDDRWGVRFEIKGVTESRGANNAWISRVRCDNEAWAPDQFKYEVAEFQTDRPSTSQSTSPDGTRYQINGGNTRNTLIFETYKLKEYSDVRAGDYVMIVGLPRIGGFVSMTLQNEYGQIAARVIEYGNPERDIAKKPEVWYGWSAEKFDPTFETWQLTKQPTFGGSITRAKNHTLPAGDTDAPVIKNGPFGSVGEVQRVRSAEQWRNIGRGARAGETIKVLQGVAEYFCTAGIRLDPEDEGAHIQGWQPAFGECSQGGARAVVDENAAWENDIWKNQSVRMLTGRQRGETFAVTGNKHTSLTADGRSTPGRVQLSSRTGDRFAVGPGYSSAMYYTRQSAAAGEWEWKTRRIPSGSYDLYLAGLNDSIHTTEFLEENNNAGLDVLLYNYQTRAYDTLATGKQYEKSDMVLAGKVSPQHISESGALRLKLVSHNVEGKRTSGFAWFDYAYLTPAPAAGRININTASPRILMALGGLNAEVAGNIAHGLDDVGRPVLKPYKSIADLLRVRGMDADLFSAIANLITVRSDQYNVYVTAQRLVDANKNGVFDAGDTVLATARVRVLLDRSGLWQTNAPAQGVQVLERERM